MHEMRYDYLDESYQTIARLGSTEKKSTYLARDCQTGKIVVKKYISLENAKVYECLKEIRHRNLISIFHVAKKEKLGLVIMEYVSGQTLEEYGRERGLFSEEEVTDYLRQLLEALAQIHKKGIVHRDISPKNVLISTDGVVKLLDFDIGRFHKPESRCDTEILGTAGYAAPEQFGFGQSDKRSDIFAIGVLANQMLTGALPQENAYADGRLAHVIEKCTQMDPSYRYQSAEEILSELELKERALEHSIWPGFRTNRLWKKVVAFSYYILMGIYSAAFIVDCAKTPLTAVLEMTAIFVYVWLTVFLPLDFLHWMEKTPIVRKFSKTGKIVLGILLWIFLFCVGYELEKYVRFDLLHIPKQ